jgi:predicted oxidoreductase
VRRSILEPKEQQVKKQAIAGTPYVVSRMVYGCMGLGGDWNAPTVTEQARKDAVASVRAALDAGMDYFDHADIYGHGKSEEAFSAVWDQVPSLRHSIVLQTKCGIRFANDPPGTTTRFDFSSAWIQHSVEGSLRRLKTDFVDILLLHRPDALVEPEEVADAFDRLHRDGKVKYFGVSNHSAAQIELLRRWVTRPFVVNQLELDLVHNQLFNAGITMDQRHTLRSVQLEGTLEYCRTHDITVQAWSPVAHGAFARALDPAAKQPDDPRFKAVALAATELGKKKGVGMDAILLAWILRHPARIQPVLGTVRPDRIRESCKADSVELTREEWYSLFAAGREVPMP